MKFDISVDSVMTEIPGNHSFPGKVHEGGPIRGMGPTMEATKGKNSGGGASGLGHNGKTDGPGGVKIKGFMNAPPQVSASHPTSVRDQSNPFNASTQSGSCGCSLTRFPR